MKVEEKHYNKLLVEGNDDQHVVWALCNNFDIPENFDVIDCSGIDKLFAQISVRLKQSGLNCLGIVVDADVDVIRQWDKLREILVNIGYSVPDQPNASGSIIKASNLPTLGVWLMPNNQLNGTIEDFITILVSDKDQGLPFAKQTLDTLESQQLHKYRDVHKSKALIHTWLAWQEDPGTPLGLAITKSYLNTNKDLCQQFVNWLDRLFNNSN